MFYTSCRNIGAIVSLVFFFTTNFLYAQTVEEILGTEPSKEKPRPKPKPKTLKVKTERKPLPSKYVPLRGFYISLDGGAMVLVYSNNLKGINYGPTVGIELGNDIGDNLALFFSFFNSFISAGEEKKYEADSPSGGVAEKSENQKILRQVDFSYRMIGGGLRLYLPVAERTRVALKGTAGYALAMPSGDTIKSSPLVCGGAGLEYNSVLKHFSMGLFGEVDFFPTLFGIGVSVFPTVKYTF